MVVCDAPQDNSLLFDGDIPVLTGLDGEQWASGLLTLHTSGGTSQMKFRFDDAINNVKSIQVVMFNCPQWGISSMVTSIFQSQTISEQNTFLRSVTSITSCDSLVRVCVNDLNISQKFITIQFTSHGNSDWIHIAEVTFFFRDVPDCPPLPTQIHTSQNTTSSYTLPTTPTLSPTFSPTSSLISLHTSSPTPLPSPPPTLLLTPSPSPSPSTSQFPTPTFTTSPTPSHTPSPKGNIRDYTSV